MGTFYSFKEIYADAFKNMPGKTSAFILKAYSWFAFACLAMVFYAFFSRLASGAAF